MTRIAANDVDRRSRICFISLGKITFAHMALLRYHWRRGGGGLREGEGKGELLRERGMEGETAIFVRNMSARGHLRTLSPILSEREIQRKTQKTKERTKCLFTRVME